MGGTVIGGSKAGLGSGSDRGAGGRWGGERYDGDGTYEVGSVENLASTQYLLLGRLVGILLVGEVEAGRAARVLALLQRRRVTLVHAVQRASTHTPVEVVHAFALHGNTSKTHQ